jgi:hypothetical protein
MTTVTSYSGAVSIGSTATELIAGGASTQIQLVVQNTGLETMYLGQTSAVTPTYNVFPLTPGKSTSTIFIGPSSNSKLYGITSGGTTTAYFYATYTFENTETVTSSGAVKNAPGRLLQILVTASPSADITVYDNAAVASGTVLAIIPASTAVGVLINVSMPAASGIYASFGGTGAVTFDFA